MIVFLYMEIVGSDQRVHIVQNVWKFTELMSGLPHYFFYAFLFEAFLDFLVQTHKRISNEIYKNGGRLDGLWRGLLIPGGICKSGSKSGNIF